MRNQFAVAGPPWRFSTSTNYPDGQQNAYFINDRTGIAFTREIRCLGGYSAEVAREFVDYLNTRESA